MQPDPSAGNGDEPLGVKGNGDEPLGPKNRKKPRARSGEPVPPLRSGLISAASIESTTSATIPRPGGDRRIAALAEANCTARRDAAEQLEHWFPGLDVDGHAQNVDDRGFQVLDIGDSLLEQLDGVATMQRVLTESELSAPILRVIHGEHEPGAAPPVARIHTVSETRKSMISIGAMAAALANGWTNVVNGLDTFEPRAARVNQTLESVYGCRVNTNVYLSCGMARGFGQHWDMHDTYIVQITGTKRWRVYEPTQLSPLKPWVDEGISSNEVWAGELSPGSCLVIPRGWGHEVEGSDHLSIHYTIGINRQTAGGVLSRAAAEAGTLAELRADLPFDPSAAVESYAGSVTEGRQLASVFAELATPELIDRTIANGRAQLRRQVFGELIPTLDAMRGDLTGLTAQLFAPVGVMAAGFDATGIRVAVQGRVLGIAEPAVDLFIALADCRPHLAEDLPEVADHPDGRATVIADLARLGVVAITR